MPNGHLFIILIDIKVVQDLHSYISELRLPLKFIIILVTVVIIITNT